MSDRKNLLRIFEAHGVEFTGSAGSQMYGYDPFSGKENKFYVNTTNGLWDSKSAGLSGNISKFLMHRSRSYRAEMTGPLMRRLTENRQLHRDAFRDWEIGWDGTNYTWPVRDINNNVVDIRRFSIKAKLIKSTPGAHVGLFGSHLLKMRPTDPIYICEGEWDAIAMHYLLRYLDQPGVVVGVPGSNTFKKEWVHWFQGRDVYLMYDNDPPGEEGEKKAKEMLTGIARRIYYLRWPDDVPAGFDTRDWIVYGTTIRHTPEICLEKLRRRFVDQPRSVLKDSNGKIRWKPAINKFEGRWKKPPTIEQVHEVFNKWLFLKNTDSIDVLMATVLTQRIDGSPCWMFIVGPPGSAKTVMVTSVFNVGVVHATSSLTAPSLISGSQGQGDGDPSLIPKLNGKILAVKDFTSILSLADREQKEIFGILRDAYDGKCGKIFGNGISRDYESRFTMIAATTPKIYDLAESHQALGERFLKFLVGDNLVHESENDIIARAIENSDRETVMHQEMSAVVKAFIEKTKAKTPPAILPSGYLKKIVALAKFGARLRGTVSRDFYRNDIMMSRPTAEVGTRLGQQLAKLARGLAMVYGHPEVGPQEYVLIKKVMLDTISQRNEDVIRAMIRAMGGTNKMIPMSMREIALKTHYPFSTIQRLMQDLQALHIIQRVGAGVATTWRLSDYVHNEIRESELYTDDELSRPNSGKIRLILRPPKEQPRKIRISLSSNGNGTHAHSVAALTTPPPVGNVVSNSVTKSS